MIYADYSYYRHEYGGSSLDVKNAPHYLREASRAIDALTYSRIVATGFENLTDYQQGVVREVCCALADFRHSNADIIESALSGYSINGVSMSMGGGGTAFVRSGVLVSAEIYSRLATTGLCYGGIG